MKRLLGIAAKKQHGKDTARRILGTCGYHGIALADPIKRIVMETYGLTWDEVYDDVLKEKPIPHMGGATSRRAQQIVGTECARAIYEDTWVDLMFKNITQAEAHESVVLANHKRKAFLPCTDYEFPAGTFTSWAISDVRFPNEVKAIRACGGLILKVERFNADGTSYGEFDGHASERYIDEIVGDFYVRNDGTLAEFEAKVLAIADQIEAR